MFKHILLAYRSVILKSGEKEHLMQDLERFRTSRARYLQLGVPYHRGYLLYGPPGTGKTSLSQHWEQSSVCQSTS